MNNTSSRPSALEGAQSCSRPRCDEPSSPSIACISRDIVCPPRERQEKLHVNVEDTLQRTSVTLAAVSHDAWAADVCATP